MAFAPPLSFAYITMEAKLRPNDYNDLNALTVLSPSGAPSINHTQVSHFSTFSLVSLSIPGIK